MAYEIVKRLQTKGEKDLFLILQNNIETKRRANNKPHDVQKLSFDWKYCNSILFIKQKLNYMQHDNPCTGKWNLCSSPIEYIHSWQKITLPVKMDFILLLMLRILNRMRQMEATQRPSETLLRMKTNPNLILRKVPNQ